MKIKFRGDVVDEGTGEILGSISAYSIESFEEELGKLEIVAAHAKFKEAGGEEEDDDVVGVGDPKETVL